MSELALTINGGKRLAGTVEISGAKNAALPCLFATLLTDYEVTLRNVPIVEDVNTTLRVLQALGKEVDSKGSTVIVKGATSGELVEVPQEEAVAMRASILCLGPLLAKRNNAVVPLPGGCDFGTRPIDIHISALERMGAEISLDDGVLNARSSRLEGAELHLAFPTFTGTENVLMAAVLANGITTIDNAAREPEVESLAYMLKAMGAEINGMGTSKITVSGVRSLKGCEHRIIADRIEAGTYLAAAAATQGEIFVKNLSSNHMLLVLEKLESIGAVIRTNDEGIMLLMEKKPVPMKIRTEAFPGFPTDLQAQFMALAAVGGGLSTIEETIWPQRFRTARELVKLGADIGVENSIATVNGGKELVGATVVASDLRASAALVIAGLCASGTTVINGVSHLLRGYQDLPAKFSALGADIKLS